MKTTKKKILYEGFYRAGSVGCFLYKVQEDRITEKVKAISVCRELNKNYKMAVYQFMIYGYFALKNILPNDNHS